MTCGSEIGKRKAETLRNVIFSIMYAFRLWSYNFNQVDTQVFLIGWIDIIPYPVYTEKSYLNAGDKNL